MLPPHAQRLLALILGSQAKHEILYTQRNRRHMEEWTRNVLKFYRADSRRLTRRRGRMAALRSARQALAQLRTEISQMIEMIISFESILTPPLPSMPSANTLGLGKRNSADGTAATDTKNTMQSYLGMLEQVYTDIARAEGGGGRGKRRAPRRSRSRSRSQSPGSRSPQSRRIRSRSLSGGKDGQK